MENPNGGADGAMDSDPAHLKHRAEAGAVSKRSCKRTTFRTSRLLDFASEKELVTQTGHGTDEWPLVVLKKLVDNALDNCEEAGIAPVIIARMDQKS